jgi:hypothetical protein
VVLFAATNPESQIANPGPVRESGLWHLIFSYPIFSSDVESLSGFTGIRLKAEDRNFKVDETRKNKIGLETLIIHPEEKHGRQMHEREAEQQGMQLYIPGLPQAWDLLRLPPVSPEDEAASCLLLPR